MKNESYQLDDTHVENTNVANRHQGENLCSLVKVYVGG
jgi:hypothetical protein